jgi:predicted flap endonuclease-1-like 5' DNA nuclease
VGVVYSILAFLIGLLAGWLVWGRRAPDGASPVAEPEASAVEPSPRPHVSGGLVEDSSPAPGESPVASSPVEAAPVVAEPVPATVAAAESTPAVVEPLPAVAAEPVPATVAAAESAPSAVADSAPSTVAVADPDDLAASVPAQRNGAGDDLKRLEGVGPKAAAALNAAGITTYAQLAEADDATIRAAFASAGMRRPASAVTWPRQARLLADGDLAGFTQLARSIKATRP